MGTQTNPDIKNFFEQSPKVLNPSYQQKQVSSPRSPEISDIEDRVQEATESYGLITSDGIESLKVLPMHHQTI